MDEKEFLFQIDWGIGIGKIQFESSEIKHQMTDCTHIFKLLLPRVKILADAKKMYPVSNFLFLYFRPFGVLSIHIPRGTTSHPFCLTKSLNVSYCR